MFATANTMTMLSKYPNAKFILTPVKAQQLLAQHDTHISLDDAEIMLELLRKLSKLSVSETINHAVARQINAPEGEIVKP